MIFCTKKAKTKQEIVGVHKQISFRSFKKYSIDEYENILVQVIFFNYENYSNNILNKIDNGFSKTC